MVGDVKESKIVNFEQREIRSILKNKLIIMDKSFNFIKDENLYNSGQFFYDGKPCIKYVDFIVFEEEKYCHIILIKLNNYFTFKVADTMADIPFTIAPKVLLLAQKIDYSSFSSVTKPNVDCFERLSTLINDKQTHYQDKNIVLNLTKEPISYKKISFTIGDSITILTMNVCISNMQTNISLTIKRDNYFSIRNLDKIFEIKANGQVAFFDLLCNKVNISEENNINMSFITEKEFYLNTKQINKSLVKGTALWALQITDYMTNLGRDMPIEMKIEGVTPKSNRLFFIFAIYGLKIQNDLRFGLVTFSNESGTDGNRTQEFKDLITKEPDCYAQIAVFDSSVRNAISNARLSIMKAIELLQILILDDSTSFFFETVSETLNYWEHTKLNCNLEVDDYFYVEDVQININYAIISNKQNHSIFSTAIANNLYSFLNNENIIENFFYLDNKKKDDLLQAVFLLNNSYRTTDKKQRVISLYNSIEFILTGEAGRKLEEELGTYNEFCGAMQGIEEIVANIQEDSLKQRMKGIIKGAFSGNSSVKSKLEILTQKIGLTMSESDWVLFDKLKNNRQKLIHNKKVDKQISSQELDELYHLVSKIIIYSIIYNANKDGLA